ncbi:MAG TPA: hypothetical protein VHO48_07865 [Anaerolineaceae bacterium]|nr:hypothetical protein [Anaerolineaceae bacterium]
MNPHSKTIKTLRVLISLLVCFGVIAFPQLGTQANSDLSQNNAASFSTTALQAASLIPAGSTWKYLDNGSDQGTKWLDAGFDDSAWKSGPAELGYGDGDEKTVVSYGANASAKYITTYFRGLLTIENGATLSGIKLGLKADDGAVVYINGKEAYRVNMPTGTVGYKTTASKASTNPLSEKDLDAALFVSGVNVVAVEVHQASASSSDISFDLQLSASVTAAPAATTAPTTAPTAAPTTEPTAAPTTAPTTAPTAAPTTAPATQQPTAAPSNSTLIANGGTWKYLDNGSDQGTNWRSTSFNDGQWKTGSAELGYGDGDEKTVVSYGSNSSAKYITTYFRTAISVTDPAAMSAVNVTLRRDDGAIIYVNGKEALRSNMPTGTVTYKTLASGSSTGGTVDASIASSLFVAGNNVVAVEIHQASGSSSDISFDLQMTAATSGGTQPTQQPTVGPTTAPTTAPTVAPTTQPLPSTGGNSWYVTPNGSSSGKGTMSSPWSLSAALAGPSAVQPGDTIWVRAGTYGSGGSNSFDSRLHGGSGKYVTVRAYPGEKVVINGGIAVNAEYTIFWGFEVTNTNTTRVINESGSHPGSGRSDGFGVYVGPTKLINNVIHDTNGIGAWTTAVNVEVYGNIVYNSGWQGSDRGHGHGIYMQNQSGTKTVVDNIIFNNFSSYNYHIYTEKGAIQGFNLDSNVSLNGDILVAGSQPAARINLTGNTSYNGRVRLGYNNSVTNQDLILKNNTFFSPSSNALEVNHWKSLNVSGNNISGPSGKDVVYTSLSSHDTYAWNNNSYYSNSSSPFSVNGSGKSFSGWQSSTGFDSSGAFKSGGMSGTNVIVRPNKYETKRANIIVYNWARSNTVMIDLSSTGLQSGDPYVLHNAFNYAETIKGTYNGQPVSVPMTGWTIAKPIGYSSTLGSVSFPQFGAFILAQN